MLDRYGIVSFLDYISLYFNIPLACPVMSLLDGHTSHYEPDTIIPLACPVMSLLDGHTSHYEPDTIRLVAAEGIIIFCLLLHTTHISQPLDVSFFQSLNVYWSIECHIYVQENLGDVITKY